MAALLVVGALAAFPTTGLAQTDTTTETPTATETETTETNTTETEINTTETATPEANESDNGSIAPGAQLAGVVGVQEAEIEGDVESRAYGIQVAQAATNNSKADIVSERLAAIEARLDELEQEKENLTEARENGSMSEGKYNAKVAALSARTKNVQRLTNETNETASGLPAELLQEKGINATAIQTLQNRSSEMSGPEVAAIARSIAGENPSQSARPEMADQRGPDRTNESDAGPSNETRGNQDNGSDQRNGNDERNGNSSAGPEQGTTTEAESEPGNDRGKSGL